MSDTLRLRFRIPSELSALAKIRSKLESFLTAAKLELGDGADMELILALDEAASNIVRHAYPEPCGNAHKQIIDIEYVKEGTDLIIRLWDDGVPCDEVSMNGLPPNTPGESGMGGAIIRSIMSEVRYERTEDGRNLLEMRRCPGSSSWSLADLAGE